MLRNSLGGSECLCAPHMSASKSLTILCFQIRTSEKLMQWLRLVVVPAMYPREVYAHTGLLPPWSKGFIVDLAAHLVGSPRLRLLRVKDGKFSG